MKVTTRQIEEVVFAVLNGLMVGAPHSCYIFVFRSDLGAAFQ